MNPFGLLSGDNAGIGAAISSMLGGEFSSLGFGLGSAIGGGESELGDALIQNGIIGANQIGVLDSLGGLDPFGILDSELQGLGQNIGSGVQQGIQNAGQQIGQMYGPKIVQGGIYILIAVIIVIGIAGLILSSDKSNIIPVPV